MTDCSSSPFKSLLKLLKKGPPGPEENLIEIARHHQMAGRVEAIRKSTQLCDGLLDKYENDRSKQEVLLELRDLLFGQLEEACNK